jgi:hypothetical protein
MKMPQVTECDVSECAYNKDSMCHALAITIGDDRHPRCDTFLASASRGGDAGWIGQVGACKVESCKFNKNFECGAQGIRVAHHKAACADCQTFSPKT